MADCIFCKIRDGVVEKEFTYQDEDLMVFPDINPVKPVHLLIVPKKHITEVLKLEEKELWGKILDLAKKLIKDKNIDKNGYKITLNGGGYQIVDHLHVHVLGPLGRHPGK